MTQPVHRRRAFQGRDLEGALSQARAEAARTGRAQTVVSTYFGYRLGGVLGSNLVATVLADGQLRHA